MRALILRSKLITLATLDRDSSTYTEAGNEPSRPTATVSGYQDLSAAGTLTSDSAVEFRLTVNKSGAAVGGNKGGRFHWRKSTDTVTQRRGSLSPNKATGWTYAAYHASDNYERPHAVTMPDHHVLCCFADTTNSRLRCVTLDPGTDTWGSPVTIDSAVPGPGCLVPLPSGRVVCIYVRDDYTTGGARYTLGLAHSSDNGATWTIDDSHLEGWSITQAGYDEIRQLRAVYHDGFITLFLEAKVTSAQIRVWHLVSDDLGASWEEIEDFDTGSPTANDPKSWAPYVRSDGSVTCLFQFGSSGNKLGYVHKSSPRSVLANEPSFETILPGPVPDALDGTVTACVFDDGLWVFFNEDSASSVRYKLGSRRIDPDTLITARTRWSSSRDSSGGNVPNDVADFGTDTSETITQLIATPYKGGLILIHNPLVNNSTAENIGALYCGGYSSVDWAVNTFGTHKDSSGDLTFGMLFLGSHDPASIAAWTVTGAATGSNVERGYQIVSSSNAKSITRNGPSAAAAGAPCLVWGRLAVTSGGVLGSDKVAIRVRRADGVNDYDISAQFTSTTMQLYDNNASARVGDVTSGLTADTLIDVLIGLDANRAALYYKLPGASLWTLVASGTLTNDSGSPDSTNAVTWGVLDTTGSATAVFSMLGSSIDRSQQPHAVQNFTNPDDLQGRPFSTGLQWLGDTEGVTISAKGGPAFTGDAYTVATRARYGLQHLDPVASPARAEGWRSVSTTLHNLVWTPNGGAVTRMLSSSIGVYLYGFNAALAYFEAQQSGGTWDTLITFNGPGSFGTGLTYTIDGDVVRPASGTGAGTQVIEPGSLIGGYVLLTHSGGTNAYPITDNTGGLWQFETGTRPVEIRLGTSPSLTTPTDIKIIPPALAAVAHNITTPYKAFRLRIPASQDTYEGYYTLGHIHAGPLLVFGKQYSRGRIVADEAQVERVTLPSGLPVVRSLGRSRRRCEFGWVDGIDTQQLHQPTSPDYIRAKDDAAYLGIALRHDPYHLGGLLRRQEGALPLVYLPGVSADTGSAQLFSQPRSMLFGWPGEVVTHDHPLGDENSSEIITINTFTITEGG
jgi:hypothetical protein